MTFGAIALATGPIVSVRPRMLFWLCLSEVEVEATEHACPEGKRAQGGSFHFEWGSRDLNPHLPD